MTTEISGSIIAEGAIVGTLAPVVKKPIVLTIKNFIDAEQLKVDLSYSLVDLNNAFLNQVALANHYGELNAKARHQVNDLKLKLEIAEAKIYRNTRDACVAADEKFTEPYLQNCVKSHRLVIALKNGINEAIQVQSAAATAVEAFHQRKGMLELLGRAEISDKQGEMRIMDQAGRDAILERAKARVTNRSS